MPIKDQAGWLHGRVQEYMRTRNSELILSAEVSATAAALRQALRTIDRATAPDELYELLFLGSTTLGWLHYLRSLAHSTGVDNIELARAIVCLEVCADEPEALPTAMELFLGPAADPDAQAEVGLAFLTESREYDDPALLDAGILLMRSGAMALPRQDPDRSIRLSNLCLAHRHRYERDGVPADLDLAVSAGEEAVAITTTCEADPIGPLRNLASAYWSRHRLRRDPADLHRVIELLQWRLTVVDPHASVLSDLGLAYRHQYEQSGEPAHLDQAIEHGERAQTALLAGDDPIDIWSNLSGSLLRRYERNGTPADIRRATELASRVVAIVADDDPDRGIYLADSALVFLADYAGTKSLAGIHRVVDLYEQALPVLPDGHPHRQAVLANLAGALRLRFERTGSAAELDRAIELGRRSLTATPVDPFDQSTVTGTLVGCYLARYEYAGALADLAQAIELGEQMVADKPDNPENLSVLGNAYQQRYSATGAVADLDRAIELGEQSLLSTTGKHYEVARRQARLAITHEQRHLHNGGRADLDRAIDLGELAVAGTPEGHIDRAAWLTNLASAYLDRYRLDRSSTDGDRGLELGEQALAAVSADDPSRVRVAANLAFAYRDRVVAGGRGQDPERLSDLVREVNDAEMAVPADRVGGRYALGTLAQALGQDRLAVAMLDAAVAMLPLVTSRAAGWDDQQHRLGAHIGLAGAAIAAHCAVGDPAGAVEIAELSRGVLLAGQADTRTDLTGLESRQPGLAKRLRGVRDRLNAMESPPEERKRWWGEHDALLAEIRALPGLAGFQTAPGLAELRSAAADGYVVLVNASQHRCDAVIVRADADPVLVELPDLQLADVEANAAKLLEALHHLGPPSDALTAGRRKRLVVPQVLGWLWDTIAAPVVAALPPAHSSPHRVWWMPTGFLGLLPIHAAGHPGGSSALDSVISSYIPTLRTLRDARDRPAARERHQLTIALSRTPGLPNLPAVVAEAAALTGPALLDEQATTRRVLAALSQATWAHFACHAHADLASPAGGGLLLHDGTLRLPEIGALHLPGAELAYLSACSTANHGIRHVDEALHLASAFQLAGFRHVIASLWPLVDGIAAGAARAFYRAMPATPAADEAATILHHVTRDLRDAYPDRPDLWAALIHSGP
ncbi:CHAT domain-containing protein [Acrocarpospora corrugata]|uniref:CHAT domain-containing protein n=1 Tax=Acrocarpospora corrugata TaxID=35763 RepID=A0A5M3WAP8_9ACTN|nr:CHAT domain-containing protein [Acrocarpospora corrugata]GES05449.1 CHAT domain-containing protein [Acrocarpospora corrugata]